MSRRRSIVAVAVGIGLLAGGTVAVAVPPSRPARTPASPSISVALNGREPFAKPCALLTTGEIERALGRRYTTPNQPLDGWSGFSQSFRDANDPLYQFNHAYVELAAAGCNWASGQNILAYTLVVYPMPVNPADLTRAVASWAAKHHQSAIRYAPVGGLGRWAGFASENGTSIVRAGAGHAVVTLLDYDHSKTAQRPQALQLARILVRRLTATPVARQST